MAEPSGINVKLRAAFMLPAALIIVALSIIDAFIIEISYLTVWLIPVVLFTAVFAMMLTERKRRHRNSN